METAASAFVAAAGAPGGKVVLDLRRETLRTEEVREIEMRLANGALDPSFGKGGRVSVERGEGLVALGNGNIVVGVDSCGRGGSVLELDPSGLPVPGFGSGGCAALPFTAEFVAADTQNRIIVGGSIEHFCQECGHVTPPSSEIVVARLLADGRRDPGFGEDGVVSFDADHVIDAADLELSPEISGVTATGDGGVIVTADSSLVRLDEGGAVVTDFGSGGVAEVQGAVASLYSQLDGSLLVASTEDFKKGLVSRFGPDGKPDTSFGQGGTAALAPSSEIEAIAPALGGGVLVTGRRVAEEDCRPCTAIVARLTASGQPDPSYGTAGILDLPLPPPHGLYPGAAEARALLAGADGSVLATGTDRNDDAFAVALDPAGKRNPSFAEGGTLVEHFEQVVQLDATGLALGPKGELIAGAQRYTAPGLLSGFRVDFGPRGKQRPGAGGAGSVETPTHGQVIPNGGGRVVIWGGETDDRTLRAVGPAGEPLAGYGTDGVASLPGGVIPEAVVPVPGGGVAVVGAIGRRAMAVYRLGPGGHPVRKFGRNGLSRVVYPHGFAIAFGGLVESDGSVVVTGWVDGQLGAARLLPTGRLDRSFGHGGLVRGLLRNGAFGLLIAPWRGGVVIATMRKGVEVTAQGMVRLDRRGRLVHSFGPSGVVDPVDENAPLALLTGGGRIVVVTDPQYEGHHRESGVKLRAYRPDGSIDRSFGRGGLTVYGRGKRKERVFLPRAAVAQPDGKIVIAGTSSYRQQGIRLAELELVRFR
jgi:uncharacterized delta-60 repeat protein